MQARGVPPEELGARFGFSRDAEGGVAWSALGDLVREAAARWSIARRVTLRRFVEGALRASGIDDQNTLDRIDQAIDALVHLGDLEPVFVDEPDTNQDTDNTLDVSITSTRGARLAATRPRHLLIGGRRLVVGLSTMSPSVSIERFGGAERSSSLARWAASDEGSKAQLDAAGFAECDFEDWMGVPGWLGHLERRRATETAELRDLWSCLLSNLEQFGMGVGDPTAYAIVVGSSGRYFGRPDALDGRWAPGDATPDGTWCGFVRGHGSQHLRPVIASSSGGRIVRALDLYDLEEFRWALLARGCHGQREVVRVMDRRLAFTFPCPAQWRRVAALCRVDGWNWSLPPWMHASDVALALDGALLQEAPHTAPR
jgi:hypothetical protein